MGVNIRYTWFWNCQINMGKKKQQKKGKTDSAVFKVAGSKVQKTTKGKAKPVTTNLKKMNLQTKGKTEVLDVQFTNVKESLLAAPSKPSTGQTSSKMEKVDMIYCNC